MNELTKLMADILRMREDEITEHLSVVDCDMWDSLKHMELIVTIEQTYGIALTADEIVSMVKVSEIKRILRNKGIRD